MVLVRLVRMIDLKLLVGSVQRLMELVRGVMKVGGVRGGSEMGMKVGGVSGHWLL